MLLHCRSAHKDELETIEAQKEKSTQKDALRQQDVSKMLQKKHSNFISFSQAKGIEQSGCVEYSYSRQDAAYEIRLSWIQTFIRISQ